MGRQCPVPLQPGIIYGPIASKRLGRSLGINLSGPKHKLCNYNCVYCFYGDTPRSPKADDYPEASEIISSVETALKGAMPADWLTFSGNGESTIHPDFSRLVIEIKELVRKYRPGLRIALLSNGSMASIPTVADAINEIDLAILKLDAGDPENFSKINRPLKGLVKFEQVVNGLQRVAKFGRLVMQTVLFGGEVSNSVGSSYESWLKMVRMIHPSKLQVYTLDFPIGKIYPIDRSRLIQIAEEVSDTGIEVNFYMEN